MYFTPAYIENLTRQTYNFGFQKSHTLESLRE